MNILIFGATGGTGKHLLQQALDKGYNVTAIVRNPSKLNITNNNLKIIVGDVLNELSYKDEIKNNDAVLCCLGAPATKAGTLRSEGTKNIIDAMKDANVKRFICQSSLGFDDSKEVLKQTPFVFKNIIVPLLLKKTFEEHHLQETAIKESNLNWTIVRSGSLTNGRRTDNYKYGFSYNDKNIKVKISRADVAQFMLEQLTTDVYNKSIVGVSD